MGIKLCGMKAVKTEATPDIPARRRALQEVVDNVFFTKNRMAVLNRRWSGRFPVFITAPIMNAYQGASSKITLNALRRQPAYPSSECAARPSGPPVKVRRTSNVCRSNLGAK